MRKHKKRQTQKIYTALLLLFLTAKHYYIPKEILVGQTQRQAEIQTKRQPQSLKRKQDVAPLFIVLLVFDSLNFVNLEY